MIITAIVMINNDEHEFKFEINEDSTEKEILEKAFEIAMYKYVDFDEVYIESTEIS